MGNSIQRLILGSQDTNQNQADFSLLPAAPQNTSSPPFIQLFTTGNDTVDLNSFDLSAYALNLTTDALAGDDVVTLSNTQNLGVLFNGNSGNDSIAGSTSGDVIDGGADNDTLVGSTGADSLLGGAGND